MHIHLDLPNYLSISVFHAPYKSGLIYASKEGGSNAPEHLVTDNKAVEGRLHLSSFVRRVTVKAVYNYP